MSRKTSEVILSLEKDVKNLNAQVRNLQNTLNILINRIDQKLISKPELASVQAPAQASATMPAANVVPTEVAAPITSVSEQDPYNGLNEEERELANALAASTIRDKQQASSIKETPIKEAPIKETLIKENSELNEFPSPEEVASQQEKAIDVDLSPGDNRRTSRTGKIKNALVKPSNAKKTQVQQEILYTNGDAVQIAAVNVFTLDGQLARHTRTNSFGKWIAALTPGQYKVKITRKAIKNHPRVQIEFDMLVPEQDIFQIDSVKI